MENLINKKKRYWKRGGVIGLVVSLLIVFLEDYLRGKSLNLPVSFVVRWFNLHGMAEIMSVLYTIIGCIVIGIVIGFIYGRRRKRI